MKRNVLLIVFCVIFSEANTQCFDSVMSSSPSPVVVQNSRPTLPSSNSKWDELMPALQMIKNTSKIKKERLLNVVKIINFLLSDELDINLSETEKIFKELNETEDTVPNQQITDWQNKQMPDIDRIVEERLKAIKEVIDDRKYMLDSEKPKTVTALNESAIPKNKTADFSRILSRIAVALAKSKDQNQSSESQTPFMVQKFRQNNGYINDFPLFENPRQLGNSVSAQTGVNPMASLSMFNIPCQRASDILEETATYKLPREAFYDNPGVNLNALAKKTKLNLENLPISNIVPNSISVVDSGDSVAILLKPKTISLMQVYGNLLKKITINVLVPYYVSKMAL